MGPPAIFHRSPRRHFGEYLIFCRLLCKRSAKPEAHCNTMEGIWTGVRIFLAPFRGVSKWYQAQYAAVFAWVYNTKRITGEFVRALLGLRIVANPGT